MLSALLAISIVVLVVVFTQKIQNIKKDAKLEQSRLKELVQKYDGLISKEEFEKQLDANINLKENEFKHIVREQEELNYKIINLQNKLTELEDAEYIQSFGFYQSKYNFGSSEAYRFRLEQIRAEQKTMLKNNTAAICHIEWEVEGSKTKGKKMINNFIKLLLRAFNGECDAAILQVKYNNVNKLEKRINTAFETLNKLAESNRCTITPNYLNLKLQELYLTHEFQENKQEELEEQRRIKEQMREEEKERREIEKVRKEAEQEVKRREQALEQARREIEQAVDNQREQLELKIQNLTQQLGNARANEQRAISRAQMTKSGHVYVISNIGSFGEDIYKIGMTRRLEPQERVRELSGASVPFPFDVHAIIFSENAPEMEKMLHQYLRDKSVNKVNERKEFFKVSLEEIDLAVKRVAQETKTVKETEIKFTRVAEAEQYRKTIAIEQGEIPVQQSSYTPSWDEDEEESEDDE